MPALAVAAVLVLVCPLARAECADGGGCADEEGGGRLRLDLDLGLVGYTYLQAADSAHQYDFNRGLAPVPCINIGIGRELTDRLSLGARLSLGFSALRLGNSGADSTGTNIAFDYAVLPYLEYAFGADRIRPHLTVVAGLDGTVASSKREWTDDAGESTRTARSALILGAVGLGGGLHVFLADGISVDFWVLEVAGFGALHDESREYGETSDSTSFAWRSRTELFVGITGWIRTDGGTP